MMSGANACKSCRSRQELSNEIAIQTSISYFSFLLAKFGFDTADRYLQFLKIVLSTSQLASQPRTSPAKFAGNIVLFRYFELSGI